ncbi:MAG TPA: hypothetical protein VGJ22_11525 [Anaerolineales bacterium]
MNPTMRGSFLAFILFAMMPSATAKEKTGQKTHILRIPEKHFIVVILTNRNEGQVAAFARNVLGVFVSPMKIRG